MPAVLLPQEVRNLMHDCDSERISWEEHRAFVIDRVLSEGGWEAIRWLRRTVGGEALRSRLEETRGRRLSQRQIRFWQVLLDTPERQVAEWLADPARRIWDQRSGRA